MKDKQSYHKPEFRVYGNISVMTQSMGRSTTSDGGTGTDSRKS